MKPIKVISVVYHQQGVLRIHKVEAVNQFTPDELREELREEIRRAGKEVIAELTKEKANNRLNPELQEAKDRQINWTAAKYGEALDALEEKPKDSSWELSWVGGNHVYYLVGGVVV